MKQILALIAMTAVLAGCSTLFKPTVSNTLPGAAPATAPAPAPVAAPAPAPTPAPAPAPPPAAPAPVVVGDQGLLDADRNLATAVLDKGLGAGLAGVVEADATILTPGGAYVGVEQIRTGLRPAANAGQLFWIPEKASSGASGDYGSTSGRYVQVLRGAEAVQGRYVSVWRKDGAGAWRIVSATAMPVRLAAAVTTPAPAPAAAVKPKAKPKAVAKAPAKRVVQP